MTTSRTKKFAAVARSEMYNEIHDEDVTPQAGDIHPLRHDAQSVTVPVTTSIHRSLEPYYMFRMRSLRSLRSQRSLCSNRSLWSR